MYKYKCHQQTVTASIYLLVTANFMHAVHQFQGEEKYILAYFSVTESWWLVRVDTIYNV